MWLYHHSYNGALYISEIVDKIAPKNLDALYKSVDEACEMVRLAVLS